MAVAGNLRFKHLSAGVSFTCGITTTNQAYCWGRNVEGQLGTGNQTPRLVPTRIAGELVLTQIVAHSGNSCAVTSDRKAYCWGDNGYGQIGDGTSGNIRVRPTQVISP